MLVKLVSFEEEPRGEHPVGKLVVVSVMDETRRPIKYCEHCDNLVF